MSLFIIVISLWILLVSRAGFLQIFPNERLQSLKNKQFNRTVVLRSKRGGIYDRRGKPLAFSVTSYSLFADPKLIKNPSSVAKKISRYLKISRSKILKKIREKRQRRFIWVKRYLNKKEYNLVKSWKIRGLGFIKEPKRLYPNESLLGQVLGFVGRDKGLEGLERQYNSILQGDERKVEVLKDARGRSLVEGEYLFNSIRDGEDVHLSIDSEIQYVLQKELGRSVKTYKADSAVGIVLDAQTSEILAMASVPDFNPNHIRKRAGFSRRNRVVTDIFEPGSTMKTFVISGALHEKIVSPESTYYCEDGEMRIGRRVIREADRKHSFKNLTVSQILAKSSNIGTTKIAFDLGSERLQKTLLNFGFGKKTGIIFPGEAKGIVKKLPWHKHLLSNVSFGHGIAVTPLQVANAYGAIANGGVLLKPSLVKLPEGSRPHEIRRVLSRENAEKIKMMLTKATENGGTGVNGRVKGFVVSGKTGTAQKVNPKGRGYLRGAYISSFAGFIPAKKPRFVIYVAVDNPKESYYGSQVAAPIFSKVASFAVRNYGLLPTRLNEKNISPEKVIKKTRSFLQTRAIQSIRRSLKYRKEKLSKIPDLKKLTLREVLKILSGSDIKVRVRGRGRVSSMSPKAGNLIPKNKTVKIFLE